MRHLALLTFVLAAVLSAVQPVHAQQAATLQVTNLSISYEFGTYIAFQAQINLPSPPSEAYLLFRADGEDDTRVLPLKLDAQGNSLERYDLNAGAVRPFATVRYHYRVKLQTGAELTSDEYFFQYEDNRFTWQVFSGDQVTIHWYTGDLTFGQDALDVARRGIKKANELLLVSQAKPIEIYIYASSTDLTEALEIGGLSAVGGHATPDLRLGLVSIQPGPEQGLEMDQKIPHELAHILSYELMGERYTRLPVWLREGIAAQVELAANPNYPLALTQASNQGALLSIESMCAAFPPESGRLFLAYAESESFTRFIINKFGQTGLLALTSAYGDGLNCKQGMQQAYGQSLATVEAEWRASVLGENAGLTAFTNLFPYLAVLVVLLTVSLVSAFTIKKPQND
jgi:hypothetical protein